MIKEKAAEAAPNSTANILNISDIDKEIQQFLAAAEDEEKVGMFVVKSANQTIREAAQRPNPKPLWLELWYEGEVSCLFADSNAGKSLYAVQIGVEVAKSEKVLYFDFELSDKQFQLRYTANDGTLFSFPPLFYRVEVSREGIEDNFAEAAIKGIEETALRTGAKVLIVDNITWICSETEKGGDAANLMKKLLAMKFRYGWSLLVIAHTPKRNMSNPITQNDLAGSKKLFNFFDSVFSIGKSAKDEALRYVKQIKCRYGSFSYDSSNVIVYTIEQENAFTHFVAQGYAEEREHLKEPTEKQKADMIASVKKMVAEGKSYRQVAKELGISLNKVQRYLKM